MGLKQLETRACCAACTLCEPALPCSVPAPKCVGIEAAGSRARPPAAEVCGCNSVVECHLAKVDVEGSSPFTRSQRSKGQASERLAFSLFRACGPTRAAPGPQGLLALILGLLTRPRYVVGPHSGQLLDESPWSEYPHFLQRSARCRSRKRQFTTNAAQRASIPIGRATPKMTENA